MSEVEEGFGGRFEVVGAKREYRRWPDELKARIVTESFQAGARVSTVAQARLTCSRGGRSAFMTCVFWPGRHGRSRLSGCSISSRQDCQCGTLSL